MAEKAEEKRWKLKRDFGDPVDGPHEESFGTEAQLRAKYRTRLPDVYFEAQGDEPDSQILVFASEDDAANGIAPIGEVFPAP